MMNFENNEECLELFFSRFCETLKKGSGSSQNGSPRLFFYAARSQLVARVSERQRLPQLQRLNEAAVVFINTLRKSCENGTIENVNLSAIF